MAAVNTNSLYAVQKEGAVVNVKNGDGSVSPKAAAAVSIDVTKYNNKYVASDAKRTVLLYVYKGLTYGPGNSTVTWKAFSGKEIKDINVSYTNAEVVNWKRGGDLDKLQALMKGDKTAAASSKSATATAATSTTSGGGFNGNGANDLNPVVLPPATQYKNPFLVLGVAVASFVLGGIALFKKRIIK